jgi:ribose transport system substrate-binding protein
MRKNQTATMCRAVLTAFTIVTAVSVQAQEVNLMDGVTPRPGDTNMTKANAFKKEGPWKIGMSHFGVNANTWTVQMANEAEGAAAKDKRVGKFILLDSNINQAKQVADIEDLIAQKVDALIVTPLTATSADAGIKKAVAAGIPVIVHTGLTETSDYTVDIQGGGFNFGKVMGDFLVKKLGGKGNIWVIRGLPAHPEDVNRYKGLEAALKGTQIKIVAEDHGSWQYDSGKKVCETFYLSNPKVDGIWSSGADMSRACIDVFNQFGAKVPPITGEGNNGFFGQWANSKGAIDSISAEYSPAQGAAGVRAAIALLEGKVLNKRYIYEPAGWDVNQARKAWRKDLSANVWWPTELSEADLQKYYGRTATCARDGAIAT